MKRLTSLLTAITLALTPLCAFAEGEDIKIFVDGELLHLTDASGRAVYPIVIDGTTYLPVRAISGAVGLEAEWDEASRSIYLSSGTGRDVIAEENIFGNLDYYAENCYELLGRSAFLSRLRTLLGSDYDALLFPAVASWYAQGDEELLTLHGYTPGREFVSEAVIDVYRSGRIDAAVLAPQSSDSGGKNAVKYYSSASPHCVESSSIKSFIAAHATGNELGYNIVDFCSAESELSFTGGTYTDVMNGGSFTFTADAAEYKFSGKITQPNGAWCSTGGTLTLDNGCAVCIENGKPSILFAFSGNYLTVVSLSDKTKALTSICTK